ncbi:MAG: FmdB family zinc ribbon protein [Acidimicrobiia bacterium]
MPTYEYACTKCGEHLEVHQTFSEDPLKRHNQSDGSKCTGTLQKVFSPVGIVLKGSGFYKTDSRNASRAKSKASETKSSSDSGTSDSKSADSGSDTTTSSKSDSKSDSKKSDSSSKKSTSTPAKKSA